MNIERIQRSKTANDRMDGVGEVPDEDEGRSELLVRLFDPLVQSHVVDQGHRHDEGNRRVPGYAGHRSRFAILKIGEGLMLLIPRNLNL